ncbi:unnamed protein product, partial [Allacma fusca]
MKNNGVKRRCKDAPRLYTSGPPSGLVKDSAGVTNVLT